jgi:hypothetical protein
MKNKKMLQNALIILVALVVLAIYAYSKLEEKLQKVQVKNPETATEITTPTSSTVPAATSIAAPNSLKPDLGSGSSLPGPKSN